MLHAAASWTRERWKPRSSRDRLPVQLWMCLPRSRRLQHPFFALDNILLAPHAIAWTHELFQEISLMCCQQALALSKGKIPAGLINNEVRERPNFLEKLRRIEG